MWERANGNSEGIGGVRGSSAIGAEFTVDLQRGCHSGNNSTGLVGRLESQRCQIKRLKVGYGSTALFGSFEDGAEFFMSNCL